jgi:hypothetical protein
VFRPSETRIVDTLQGAQKKLRFLGEQLLIQHPVGVENIRSFRKIHGVVILNDAAHLDVGHRKGLGDIFKSFGLDNGLFKDFPAEVHDGTVRPYGAGVYVGHVSHLFRERDLDVSVLAPGFGENLDAKVILFKPVGVHHASRCAVTGYAAVVLVDFAV